MLRRFKHSSFFSCASTASNPNQPPVNEANRISSVDESAPISIMSGDTTAAKRNPRIAAIQSQEAAKFTDDRVILPLDIDPAAAQAANKIKRLVQEFSLLMECYKPLYGKIEKLEALYQEKSKQQGRLEQVSFITSVLATLKTPSFFSLADSMQDEQAVQDKVVELEEQYYGLLGACLYICEQINEEYEASTSYQWGFSSKENCTLLEILKENAVGAIDLSTKQRAMSALNILLLDPSRLEKVSLPNNVQTKQPQTPEEFKSNCLDYLSRYCPEVPKPKAVLAF